MYCLSLHNRNYEIIKELGYIPVGLGKDSFSAEWLTDKDGENISEKNPYYGEYSFHYWFWKNKIDTIDDNVWIGFCAYRRFWAQKLYVEKFLNKEDFLHTIPTEWKENNFY